MSVQPWAASHLLHSLVSTQNGQLLLQPLGQGSLCGQVLLQLLLCCHVPLLALLLRVGRRRPQGLLGNFARAAWGSLAVCLLQWVGISLEDPHMYV